MAAPSRVEIDAANKQLEAMHQQLMSQEAEFKAILEEREAEVVRLHRALQEQEERFTKKLQATIAEAQDRNVALVSGAKASALKIEQLQEAISKIAAIATEASAGGELPLDKNAVDWALGNRRHTIDGDDDDDGVR